MAKGNLSFAPEIENKGKVVQLPSRLNRLNTADQLLTSWIDIQEIQNDVDRLVAIMNWQKQVDQYKGMYC